MTREALWPFSLDVYGRTGVEAALLELQDVYGQSVPYLLWAMWLAGSGRPADAQTLAAGAALARSWQDVAVSPLRDIRRRLKGRPSPVQTQARRRLRQGVASLELEAERMLARMLEDASPAPNSQPRALAPALRNAVIVWGGMPPAELLGRLAALAG